MTLTFDLWTPKSTEFLDQVGHLCKVWRKSIYVSIQLQKSMEEMNLLFYFTMFSIITCTVCFSEKSKKSAHEKNSFIVLRCWDKWAEILRKQPKHSCCQSKAGKIKCMHVSLGLLYKIDFFCSYRHPLFCSCPVPPAENYCTSLSVPQNHLPYGSFKYEICKNTPRYDKTPVQAFCAAQLWGLFYVCQKESRTTLTHTLNHAQIHTSWPPLVEIICQRLACCPALTSTYLCIVPSVVWVLLHHNRIACTCNLCSRMLLLLFQVDPQGSRCNQLKAKVMFSSLSLYRAWPDPAVCSCCCCCCRL